MAANHAKETMWTLGKSHAKRFHVQLMVVGPITLSGLNGQNVQKAVETVCKTVPIVGHVQTQNPSLMDNNVLVR